MLGPNAIDHRLAFEPGARRRQGHGPGDGGFADAALLLRDRYDFRRHVPLRILKSVEFYIVVVVFPVIFRNN